MDIFKAEGLRNFPQRSVNIYVWNRVKMHLNPKDFFGSAKIISASCRDFNDVVSIYTLNTNGQLIKLRKDFVSGFDLNSCLERTRQREMENRQGSSTEERIHRRCDGSFVVASSSASNE
jgi:hypothetical protein